MSELEERIKIIEEQWKEVYEQCSANPTLYKSYLTEITIDDVCSVVLTVLEWLKNSKDNAIGKTYALSKQVMITSLKNTLADLNKLYMEEENLNVTLMGRGMAWLDTGTHENMLKASNFVEAVQSTQGTYVASLEEIAYRKKWITREKLHELAKPLMKTNYGKYLMDVADELDKNK